MPLLLGGDPGRMGLCHSPESGGPAIASVNPSVASRPPGLLAFGETGRNASDAAAEVGARGAPPQDLFVAPLEGGPLCSLHAAVRGSERPGGRRALPEPPSAGGAFRGLAPPVFPHQLAERAPLASQSVGRSGAVDEAEGVGMAEGRASGSVARALRARSGPGGLCRPRRPGSRVRGRRVEVPPVIGPSTSRRVVGAPLLARHADW
jgi:hypothetical protein